MSDMDTGTEPLREYQERLGGKIVGLFQRAMAYFFDVVFKSVIIFLLLFYVFNDTIISSKPLVVTFLFSMIYEVLFISTDLKATPGKLIAMIKVVNYKGERLSVTRSVFRFMVRFVSIFVTGIGIIAAFKDEKMRTWHDKITSSYVIEPFSFSNGEEILDQDLDQDQV